MAKPKSRSCAAYPLQRFLYSTLDCFPTTAGSAQFCLLCCQPEPFPESLPARPPSLTRRCPCSLPVWLGQSIHMVHRTYRSPRHSISHTPTWGTERCDPPQMQFRHSEFAGVVSGGCRAEVARAARPTKSPTNLRQHELVRARPTTKRATRRSRA